MGGDCLLEFLTSGIGGDRKREAGHGKLGSDRASRSPSKIFLRSKGSIACRTRSAPLPAYSAVDGLSFGGGESCTNITSEEWR